MEDLEYSKHKYAGVLTILKRLKKSKRRSIGNALQGLGYLIRAYITTKDKERSPYNDIDNGADTIYLPGYFSFPKRIYKFESISGIKCAYVTSKEVEELDRIINYVISKNRKNPNIICFSDAGNFVREYIEQKGDKKVAKFYALSTNPIKAKSKKVVHIIGDMDILASIEKTYDYSRVPHKTVYGGRTYMFSNKRTIKEISEIIKR